jgi:glucokinase
MKTIAALIVLGVLGLAYGTIVYQTKDAPHSQSADRNVPGATTGLGRDSLLPHEPATSPR